MQQTRTVELGTGLFALLGMGALFFLTTQTTGGEDFSADETFKITARFDNVGSLRARAPVSMSGVTIGRVKCLQPLPSETGRVAPGQVYVLVIPRVRYPAGDEGHTGR